MKTYTITENVIKYEYRTYNGIEVRKPVDTKEISTMQVYTDAALRMIEMYAGNISPMSLNFNEKKQVAKCRLFFEISELTCKEIIIKRN